MNITYSKTKKKNYNTNINNNRPSVRQDYSLEGQETFPNDVYNVLSVIYCENLKLERTSQ